MRFCNYLKILHSYIGTEKTQADFVIFITTLFMRAPKTKEEEREDDTDFYNPLNQLKQRTLERYIRVMRDIRFPGKMREY